jgi:DNA-binding NarL/FixJ family response regulator
MSRFLTSPIRIVIADPYPLVTRTLERLLSAERDFEVVATCHDASRTLLAVCDKAPDVVVLDPKLCPASGLEVVRQIRAADAAVRVVIHTAAMSDDEMAEARRLGVSGVVLKALGPELLLGCVRKAHAGERCIDGGSIADAVDRVRRRDAQARSAFSGLTGREAQVVRLAATGARNKDLAKQLRIAECTVKAHLSSAYEKLGVESRLELSVYAHSKGVL